MTASLVLHLTDIDHPPNCWAIRQGADYNSPSIRITNLDLRNHSLKGQIRDDYLSAGGKLLAELVFRDLIFDEVPAEDDPGILLPRSTIGFTIPKAESLLLNPLSFRSRRQSADDPFRPGKNCWVYDIEATLNGSVSRIVEGFADGTPEVTGDG